MSLEETLRDLHTVSEADIFTSDDDLLGTQSLSSGKEKVEQMRKLLRRDKEEIRHAHDAMGIRYRAELRDWLTQAGNYLKVQPLDVQRFNSSYENMLAYYAGRVVDEVVQTRTESYAIPAEVLAAHNRYWQEMPAHKIVQKNAAGATPPAIA